MKIDRIITISLAYLSRITDFEPRREADRAAASRMRGLSEFSDIGEWIEGDIGVSSADRREALRQRERLRNEFGL